MRAKAKAKAVDRTALPLGAALEAHGYADDPERFRELLTDLYAEMYRDWPLDEFLCEEIEPRVFVREVRDRAGTPALPHDLVLRTLLNMRKRGA